jgi:chromate transporter
MTSENFGDYRTDMYQFVVSILIFLVAFIGTRKFKVSPILMIALCGVAGWLLY